MDRFTFVSRLTPARRFARLFALALALSATSFALASPAVAAKKEKPTIKIASPKNMAGIGNVVVASFSIAFVTEKTDSAFAGSRNNFKANGAITKAKLAGVAPADMQAVVDAAYDDFVARMTAAGYVIADRSAMVRDKQMAKVQYLPSGAEGTINFDKDSKAKAVFFAPSAFGQSGIMKGETGQSTALAGGNILGAFSAMSLSGGPTAAKVYYSIYNGQPTVSVAYVIDFASVERYGGRYAVEATVGLEAALAVVETVSLVTTTNAKGASATATVVQPIAVPGNFGRLEDITTGGQKASNVAGAVIGAVFGSGTNKYQYVTFTAQSAPYRAGAIEAAKNANAQIVPEIAARR